MEQYFRQRDPAIFNKNNGATVSDVFWQFLDEVKGEIEAGSQRGSGWVVEAVLGALTNIALYKPFCGGSYKILPEKLKVNKNVIINVKNRDNQCLRWALCALLFPPEEGKSPTRPSSYPTEDSLNFTGIDFPTPVKQIDKLEKQNPHLAIKVFGWGKKSVLLCIG